MEFAKAHPATTAVLVGALFLLLLSTIAAIYALVLQRVAALEKVVGDIRSVHGIDYEKLCGELKAVELLATIVPRLEARSEDHSRAMEEQSRAIHDAVAEQTTATYKLSEVLARLDERSLQQEKKLERYTGKLDMLLLAEKS